MWGAKVIDLSSHTCAFPPLPHELPVPTSVLSLSSMIFYIRNSIQNDSIISIEFL